MIYSVSHDEKVLRCFDLDVVEPVKTVALPGDPRRVNVNRDETLICIGCEYGGLVVLTLPDMATVYKGGDYASGAVFSPTSPVIAVAGSHPYSIRLLNTATFKYEKESAPMHTMWIHTLDYSPSGEMISAASQDYTATIINADSCSLVTRLTGHTNTVFYAIFIDDTQVVTGSEDHTIGVWSLPSGARTHTISDHKSWVFSVAVSPDGRFFASGSRDRTVRVWDSETIACVSVVECIEEARSVRFLSSSELVAGVDNSPLITIAAESGAITGEYAKHNGWLRGLAVSPAARKFVLPPIII